MLPRPETIGCNMIPQIYYITFPPTWQRFIWYLFITFDNEVKNVASGNRMADENFRKWKGRAEQKKVELNLTNRTLALRAGLSIYQVNMYMSGRYPNDNPRLPIERALGMG